jgi:uncharacterized membrane-anchored protein
VEWSKQLARVLQGIAGLVLAEELDLGGIALRHIDDLGLLYVERPHIALGSDDDALHLAELAAEVVTVGRRQRLARLVELRNRLGAVGGAPHIVVGINGQAKTDTFDSAARKA